MPESQFNDRNSSDDEELLANQKKQEKYYYQLKNNDGYVIERTKSRIINYKRYNQQREPYDYFRVMLLLYLPWGKNFGSKNKIEDVEYVEIELQITDEIPLPTYLKYLENKDVIIRNRAEFEQDDFEDILQAQRKLDAEIQQQRAAYAEEEASKRVNAINRQLNENDGLDDEYEPNQNDSQTSEDITDMYGFFEPNFVESKTFFSNEDKKNEIGYPRRISNTDYYQLMANLNQKQHLYLMNFITCFKNEEPFRHIIIGKAGTWRLVVRA